MTTHAALPLWQYLMVFAALMALLALTVLGHWMHLGVAAALGIAATKAVLVALYFMHLKGSSRIVQIVACAGLFWLAILISLSMNDYATRGWGL